MVRSKKDSGADSSWLTLIKMELSLIDDADLIEPDLPEEEELKNETHLGEASNEVRRLWTYFVTLEERATRTLVDAKYARGDAEQQEILMRKAAEMRAKAEMSRQIIFLSLRDQFGIWNPNLGIGLRKGWRVVSFKSDSNPLLDILRGGV